MSSLWTPDGEHRVERTTDVTGTAAASDDVRPASAAPVDADQNDEPRVLAEMEELERQLVAAPAEDVVANHCYGLFQLAALHLGQEPPGLDAARLAIDALAAIVAALDGRLGDAGIPLRDGLAQIRLAYVQIAGTQSGQTQAPGVSPDSPAHP